jgi:hypothetical protein
MLDGIFDVFDSNTTLEVAGAWDWTDLAVKLGPGELVFDLDNGFSTGPDATLAIVDGTVRFEGDGILELSGLAFGDLGTLSGDASLAGIEGWYAAVDPVPEPSTLALVLMAFGLMGLLRKRRCMHILLPSVFR